jgi:hypothetical protein
MNRRRKKRKISNTHNPISDIKYSEREPIARREKDLILVKFKFRKTRKRFVKHVGLKYRTRDRDDPMFTGRYKLLDLLGKERFCGLTRRVLKEIKTKEDLFKQLSSKHLKQKFKFFIDKTFLTADIKKMLLKRHSLRDLNKYAKTKDERLEALIGTLCDNKYTFNLEKRELEQETMIEIKDESQWTFLAGVGVSLDVLIFLFGFINPYEFELGVDYYQSKLGLLNGLGTTCGTSLFYQVRRLFTRIIITKKNVRKIPLITLQNARMVLIQPKGLLKVDYVHIHRNICLKVRCLNFNCESEKCKFFKWIGNNVYENLEKCFITGILNEEPKNGQFPKLKDIKLKYFNVRGEVKPLSRFGGIKCLRLRPNINTKVSPNLKGMFPETLKVLKIELSSYGWGMLLDFSDECIFQMKNLERLVFSNSKTYYEWKSIGVRNIWRYIKNIKEIQFNILKLPDDFKYSKPWGVPKDKLTSFDIGNVLSEQRFEKVIVKLKVGIVELEHQWFGIFERIRHEFGLKQEIVVECDKRPKWAQRFEELNNLKSEIPKHGYDIRCSIGKKKLLFWLNAETKWKKVRSILWINAKKQTKNYYKTITIEYTNKLIAKQKEFL